MRAFQGIRPLQEGGNECGTDGGRQFDSNCTDGKSPDQPQGGPAVSRVCKSCQISKPATTDFFYLDRHLCLICARAKGRKWHRDNSARSLENNKKWRAKRKALRPIKTTEMIAADAAARLERKRLYHKEWCAANAAKLAAYKSAWYEANKHHQKPVDRERYNRLRRERLARDPTQRVHSAISGSVRKSLTTGKDGAKWQSLLGYSRGELMRHLERQFSAQMSWANYGSYWEIDHIVSLKTFGRISSPNDPMFKMAWSITNLRPLQKLKNRQKSAKRMFLL